jgi:hypothetical protein
MVAAEVPPQMAAQVRELVDDFTKKLGGDPIPSSDWDALRQKSVEDMPDDLAAQVGVEKPRW